MEDLKKKSEGEDITVLYLSGMPGCGKTELARQIGDKFYKKTKVQGPLLLVLWMQKVWKLFADHMVNLAVQWDVIQQKLFCQTYKM